MTIKGFVTKEYQICGIISDGSKLRLSDWLIKNHSQVVNITFSKEKKPRSLPENSYYWGCIVTPLANHFGYTPTEMHDALKYLFLREEIPDKPPKIRSTADDKFTTLDAEKYYEQIRTWALTEYNFYIALPNELI